MQAIVFTEYGSPDVLRLTEVPTPEPGEHEIRIAIHATSINAGDWHLMRADPFLIRLMFGLTKPKVQILGADVAGTVDAVGAKVSRFRVGDAVFGDISECGFGAFAESVCVPETAVVVKPESISYETAAALPAAAMTALQALRDHGKIEAGQQVLINGASGGVGSYAVQIAKAFGAEVTGVCSTRNLEMVRSLGADHVIDYTKEDFTQNGKQYDLIHAANGAQSIFAYKRALAPTGRYVMSGGAMKQFFQAALLGPFLSMGGKQKFGNMLVHPNAADLEVVKELVEAGKVTPVIDRSYPLAEVADAIRYMENEHAAGKIVIAVR